MKPGFDSDTADCLRLPAVADRSDGLRPRRRAAMRSVRNIEALGAEVERRRRELTIDATASSTSRKKHTPTKRRQPSPFALSG